MRLLLTVQRGCTSYESLRIVNNVTHKSFEEACYALRLLADDKEFIDDIKGATELGSGSHLRKLLVTLLLLNIMSMPKYIWEQTFQVLADGILFDRRILLQNLGFT